jgi:pyridoxamine 5'-phosphate oxidase
MNDDASRLRNNDQGTDNPFVLFNEWLNLAVTSEPNDPSAMSVASVDSAGMPNVRIVLMRRFDERGFCFFTNFESQKGEELLASKKAAAVFHWKSLRKQIRIRGEVEPVREAEADDYFKSRPRGSQIASSASKQSRPLPDRKEFEDAMKALEAKYEGQDVPRPDHWSGFRIMPLSIEFWDDGEFRTHDRLRFDRKKLSDDWETVKLYP